MALNKKSDTTTQCKLPIEDVSLPNFLQLNHSLLKEWLGRPVNIKEANKQTEALDPAHLLFFAH